MGFEIYPQTWALRNFLKGDGDEIPKDEFEGIWGQVHELEAQGYLPKGFDYKFRGDGADEMMSREQFRQALARKRIKESRLASLGKLKGPSYAPEMERRIKVLEDESRDGPLSQDKYFQGDRAALVQGSHSALAKVEGDRDSYGIKQGGFSNVGSISDVYDRLGTQLAQLGQRSADLKAQKRDTAAQARQALLDATTEYENALVQAREAIELQDEATTTAAMERMIQAKSAAEAATKRFWGSVISGVAAGAGAALGPAGAIGGRVAGTVAENAIANPGAADAYGGRAGELGGAPYVEGPNLDVSMGGYDPRINRPWSSMRGR